MLNNILTSFGLAANEYQIQQFGAGLINRTWKVTGLKNNDEFILQQINENVFKAPNDIAENINKVGNYLLKHYPDYLFIPYLPSTSNEYIVKYGDDEYYRLSPFVKNSITINTANRSGEAFEASRQFAKFTRLLENFDVNALHYTLPDFHNLTIRYTQFQYAVKAADKKRLIRAQSAIEKAFQYRNIADLYQRIVKDKLIPLRVVHHDTKINNILFDNDHKGLCVIDLDTVMPGYYISDIGDMMRTYLSPANEEEQDFNKIEIREDFFAAIVKGYFTEMSTILTETEKSLFIYSGKFMIYMQALRFLTDFLNNDIYYHTKYAGHNLVRAENQFILLDKYFAAEERFQQIVNTYKELAD